MVRDVIELRANKWIPRREEVHLHNRIPIQIYLFSLSVYIYKIHLNRAVLRINFSFFNLFLNFCVGEL
jgi:hypothetical protein